MIEKTNKLEMVIKGRPVTKKNSQRIVVNRKTGKPFVVPSKAYAQYEKDAGWFVRGKGLMIDYPVNVKCVYYMPNKRRVDLVNLLEATCDILTHYKVIKDDDSTIVVSHDGSRVKVDRENPRCEIEITAV